MTAWADRGEGGNGAPLAVVLRAGNAGANTAADHIEAAGSRSPSCRAVCCGRSWSAQTPAAARTSSSSG